ncbi:9089_t:CDS:2 [Funneliformis caledonium]|uniref:9089_t:CDS:1 n=1 Tax=Funneliformis caledonium TaxID=1117310 RepID=A0A9N9G155_9GLOM|nr:9089_t:CDS:2 [Funneliformis caledonium]
MRRTLRQLTVTVGPILFQLQLRFAEIQFQYKSLENEEGSNESSPGMTLPIAMNRPSSGTTTPIPQPPSNIPSYIQPQQSYLRDRRQYDEEENVTYAPDYEQNILFGYTNYDDETLQETSFFDNANELERGGTPSRIPRRVTFNTSNDRRSPSPVRVENVQQLVASTLSSNQSSRPSNLRITTLSVRNTNSESSLGNPYNFSQATQYSRIFDPLVPLDPFRNNNSSITFSFTTANWQPVNNRWLRSNSSNRGNNTMGHQNVITKGTLRSITVAQPNNTHQPSNYTNTSQPMPTSQSVIVAVGGNNDNAYLQVIQGLAGWLQGQ